MSWNAWDNKTLYVKYFLCLLQIQIIRFFLFQFAILPTAKEFWSNLQIQLGYRPQLADQSRGVAAGAPRQIYLAKSKAPLAPSGPGLREINLTFREKSLIQGFIHSHVFLKSDKLIYYI